MESNVITGAALIGLINGLQKQFPQVTGIVAWGVAVVLGGLAGYFQIGGVDTWQNGVVIGLASSGLFKLSTNLRKK